jgi:N-acetylneuraminate epimerase
MRQVLVYLLCASGICMANEPRVMHWSKLTPLPDPEGFASPFAGVSAGAFIVAGGANIPGEKWKEPFQKIWSDRVFVLEKPDGAWRAEVRLPHKLAYGISVSSEDSVLCFGGSDERTHYADGFRLRWAEGRLVLSTLPPLPRPCANACGALVGRTIYIAGGIETPTTTEAMHSFWALDLDAPDAGWKALETWPGPARMLSVAGVLNGDFYLISGASLSAGANGKPARTYLRDAYRYSPGKGWKRIADLPRAAVAAPSPATVLDGQVTLFSGDDGENVNFTPVSQHPGFPRTALAYDPAKDAWTEREGVPFSRATAPAVQWKDRLVIPNGEVRVRMRTPEVWSLQMPVR